MHAPHQSADVGAGCRHRPRGVAVDNIGVDAHAPHQPSVVIIARYRPRGEAITDLGAPVHGGVTLHGPHQPTDAVNTHRCPPRGAAVPDRAVVP